jgi:lysophospholipase L1-like esterase
MLPPEDSGMGITLREVAHVSIGGDTARVRFSNLYGTTPLFIGAAEVALTGQGSAILAGTNVAMTFHGRSSVSIPAGALAFSDPIRIKVGALANLTVSFYLPHPSGPITEHELGNATSYHEPGNVVSQIKLGSPSSVQTWEYLNGIDVLASSRDGAIITLGDSITDGAYATVDSNSRWPDELARRLQADKDARHFAVLNEAISGNQILQDGAGPNAMARFDRDILSQSGARYLIILEGINDIGHTKMDADNHTSADDIIFALDQLIQRAHSHGILVIGGTLTPYRGARYYSDSGEEIRKAVNEWIREKGAFDGVIDFDVVMRDPTNPDTFLPAYEHGDHLHPNDAGYKAMGDSVDLKLFTAPKR